MAEVEIWKNIPGFSGYMASSFGRIKAKRKLAYNHNARRHTWRKERMMRPTADKFGYLLHTMRHDTDSKKHWLVHRIIAFAFLKNPDNKPFINHKNGIKGDNRLENLEWCTKSENGVHAVLNRLHTPLRGEINGNSRLTEIDVLEMRELKSIFSYSQLAAFFNVGLTTVKYIIKRKLWSHI